MNPVLVTVVSSSPAVWSPYAAARNTPAPRPAAHPARGSARSGAQANGASTAVEIAKRTARKANSGYTATASWTGTNVYPQIAVTATSARSGDDRRPGRPGGRGFSLAPLRSPGRPTRGARLKPRPLVVSHYSTT